MKWVFSAAEFQKTPLGNESTAIFVRVIKDYESRRQVSTSSLVKQGLIRSVCGAIFYLKESDIRNV